MNVYKNQKTYENIVRKIVQGYQIVIPSLLAV